jgi:hypothetical protein
MTIADRTRRHGRTRPKGPMNTNEVVEHEIERQRVGVVSTRFENASIGRANRRMLIRMVRLRASAKIPFPRLIGD